MKSIAGKLWLGMMTLVGVVLLLLWLFQIVFLNNFYTQMRVADIRNAGQEVIRDMSNLKSVEDQMDVFSYNNNLTAELLDLNNQSIYTAGTAASAGMNGQMNGQMGGMMGGASFKQAYSQVLQGETVLLPLTHPRFGSQFMLIGLPVLENEAIIGALMISLPLTAVADTVSILKQQLVYITLILLATALILTYLLARSFTKPILEITRVSMAMAAGNLAARIRWKRQDEIGKLGEAINYMGGELSKIEQLRKDLLANVSHELRTPLSLIKGYGETIRDISGDSPEKREKQIGIIIEEADRLGSIVDDILGLSQMEAGLVNLTIERFELHATLNRVIKKYDLLAEKSGITLVKQDGNPTSEAGEAFVLGDEQKIEQVLYNLINNAFNHSPQGGVIGIKAIDSKDHVKIEIKDQGEGIPKEEIAYIWERFYKVDKSGKREKAGTGLGLAIVKNILVGHQVPYGVDSESGQGTTFWFELKRA